ncbi:hypothetical protein J3459_006703 [Metarhizium acridum]|nr:hypothetical protein J3459_006703 [Metarhizium acridum]
MSWLSGQSPPQPCSAAIWFDRDSLGRDQQPLFFVQFQRGWELLMLGTLPPTPRVVPYDDICEARTLVVHWGPVGPLTRRDCPREGHMTMGRATDESKLLGPFFIL